MTLTGPRAVKEETKHKGNTQQENLDVCINIWDFVVGLRAGVHQVRSWDRQVPITWELVRNSQTWYLLCQPSYQKPSGLGPSRGGGLEGDLEAQG